jgi:proline iminopeptidase
MASDGRLVALDDGGELFVAEHGSGYPLMLLHGGPGLDHHEFRPWLDPLGDMGLRLIYVDERGQGQSPRVDPATLSVRGFAQDIDRLAEALDLEEYAVLGHSFGGIIALSHALERGSASHYIISAGAASSEALMADVEREIEAFQPASMRDQIRKSWADEAGLTTAAEARDVAAAQMPFHFWEMGDAYRTFMERDDTVYAPEVLAHFASNGYGEFEWVDHLRWIGKPMLVIVGRHDRTCTLERSEEIHGEVAGSELVVIEKAAHMTFVEQPAAYLAAVRRWLISRGFVADPNAPAE